MRLLWILATPAAAIVSKCHICATASLPKAAAPVYAIVAPTPESSLLTDAVVAADPVGSDSSLLLADLGFTLFRDGVDAYYFLLLTPIILQAAFKATKSVITDAKDYDRRGALANQMMQEKRKRDRAAARQAVRKSEPATYRRMEAERASREKKKRGWISSFLDPPDE